MVLLVVTIFSYFYLSYKKNIFQKERLVYLNKKESEIQEKEQVINSYETCSEQNEKYRNSLSQIKEILDSLNVDNISSNNMSESELQTEVNSETSKNLEKSPINIKKQNGIKIIGNESLTDYHSEYLKSKNINAMKNVKISNEIDQENIIEEDEEDEEDNIDEDLYNENENELDKDDENAIKHKLGKNMENNKTSESKTTFINNINKPKVIKNEKRSEHAKSKDEELEDEESEDEESEDEESEDIESEDIELEDIESEDIEPEDIESEGDSEDDFEEQEVIEKKLITQETLNRKVIPENDEKIKKIKNINKDSKEISESDKNSYITKLETEVKENSNKLKKVMNLLEKNKEMIKKNSINELKTEEHLQNHLKKVKLLMDKEGKIKDRIKKKMSTLKKGKEIIEKIKKMKKDQNKDIDSVVDIKTNYKKCNNNNLIKRKINNDLSDIYKHPTKC